MGSDVPCTTLVDESHRPALAAPPRLAAPSERASIDVVMRCGAIGAVVLALTGCELQAAPATQTPRPAPAVAAEPHTGAPGPCGSRTEAPDGVTTTTHTYEQGRRVRTVQRGPAGERQTLWSYDTQGRRSKEVTIDAGTVSATTFHYEGGLLLRTEVDDDGAGHVVERRLRTYEDGKLVERTVERLRGTAFAVEETHALHYDEQGRFAYELETRTPVDGPSTVRSVTVDVDDEGRVQARRIDEGMTGSFERISLFSYDAGGRLSAMTRMEGEAVAEVSRHGFDRRTLGPHEHRRRQWGGPHDHHIRLQLLGVSSTRRMRTPASPNMPVLISKSSCQRSGMTSPAG